MESRRKEKWLMANKKGVSSKTHTKKQLDDYANQHNPNKIKRIKLELKMTETQRKCQVNMKLNVKLSNGLNLKRKMV